MGGRDGIIWDRVLEGIVGYGTKPSNFYNIAQHEQLAGPLKNGEASRLSQVGFAMIVLKEAS